MSIDTPAEQNCFYCGRSRIV
ncbi:MAG: hypothetical protein LBV72_13040 [Tannerella sp.]|nr:hypothetical protein [Tannerella sp.]